MTYFAKLTGSLVGQHANFSNIFVLGDGIVEYVQSVTLHINLQY